MHRGLGGNRARGYGRTESDRAQNVRATTTFDANELLGEKTYRQAHGNERTLVTGVPVIDVN